MKFNIRVYISRDHRVIGSAVAKELYETARKVIDTTWITRDHFRGSCCAFVIECYIACAVDVDSRRASRAHVEEMEFPIRHNEAGSRQSGLDPTASDKQ